MSLEIKQSKSLLNPETFHWKVLVYGLAGVGKTEWASSAPNPGFVVCEHGHGKGILTVAERDLAYVEPQSLAEFEAVANGVVFKDKQTLVLDSLTNMAKTFVKDAALAMPRKFGDSAKRAMGVPELDDYQVMAEMTRRLLAKLLDRKGHLIVTATEKYSGPDPETGQGETIIAPDLPGALSLTSTAMFDTVLRLRTRQKLKDPKDAKSRFVERYFLTGPDGQGTVAKTRTTRTGKPLLDKEEVFDLETGKGSFPDLMNKILRGYAEINAQKSTQEKAA